MRRGSVLGSRWPCPSAALTRPFQTVEPVLAAPIQANGLPAKDPVLLWQQVGPGWPIHDLAAARRDRPGEEGQGLTTKPWRDRGL